MGRWPLWALERWGFMLGCWRAHRRRHYRSCVGNSTIISELFICSRQCVISRNLQSTMALRRGGTVERWAHRTDAYISCLFSRQYVTSA